MTSNPTVDLTVNLTSNPTVDLTVSLSLAIYQTAENTESYMSDWIGSLKVSPIAVTAVLNGGSSGGGRAS